MRSQEHNQGELAELKVNIEAEVVKKLETISSNSGMTLDEIVVIATKRYISSHTDLLGLAPKTE